MFSPFLSRSCFALTRHINLNKERNKRTRGLRVDALTINAPPPRLRWEDRGGTETTEPRCLEVVLITTKRSLLQGISSHPIDSEQNTELVCCNKTSVFSSETWKRWCEYTHVGPGWWGSVVWRWFYWCHPSTQLARAGVFFFLFFALFLTFGSFCIFNIWFRKWVVRMGVIHHLSIWVSPAWFASLLAKPLPSSHVTGLTTQDVSNFHCVNIEKWLSRRQWHPSCILHSSIMCLCA